MKPWFEEVALLLVTWVGLEISHDIIQCFKGNMWDDWPPLQLLNSWVMTLLMKRWENPSHLIKPKCYFSTSRGKWCLKQKKKPLLNILSLSDDKLLNVLQ